MQIKLLLIILCTSFSIYAQESEKKKLSHADYDHWNNIGKQSISIDGKLVAYEVEPGVGDGKLVIYNAETKIFKEFSRGNSIRFSPKSEFVAFKVKPQFDTIRKLKIEKINKSKFPKDSLFIWNTMTDSVMFFSNVKSFDIPEKNSEYIAIQFEKSQEKKKEEVADKKKKKKKKSEIKEIKIDYPGTYLKILNPNSLDTIVCSSNEIIEISENNGVFAFTEIYKDSLDHTNIVVFNETSRSLDTLFRYDGTIKKLALDKQGKYLASLQTKDTSKTKIYSLSLWDIRRREQIFTIDTSTSGIPSNWAVSENANIQFSQEGKRLIFGTGKMPKEQEKDTIPDDEKYSVDIWHYNDPRIQPQQIKELESDKKKSYTAVYNIDSGTTIQVADSIIEDVRFVKGGETNYALGFATKHYEKQSTWDSPSKKDVYLIDLNSGTKKMVFKEDRHYVGASPNGSYIISFNPDLKDWITYNTKTDTIKNITSSIPVNFYNEENDTPEIDESYGLAGWTSNDSSVLIYDRYDIWEIDPDNIKIPVCITKSEGRRDSIRFRAVRLDKEDFHINQDSILLINSFDQKTKKEGFYELKIRGSEAGIKKVIDGDYNFSIPIKAKEANAIIWKKSSFKVFPDIYYSTLSFVDTIKISDVNPQLKDYLWGTVELIHFNAFDGTKLDGLLYKPENYNPDSAYPAIVYFYEKNSQNLNAHYIPKPSRSVINFPYYVSNGYIIFIPDIKYKTGNPGEDAYNCIISGTEYLIQKGILDKNRIGIQGQSWGGYQVAYLVTKTGMFAAAEAGAPVSNMTSAYGGIRWGSGISRMFQYEKGQSRIGVSLWDSPELYIKNSPLFNADKVSTPLLIMHNDNDGAVPWYQGIEFYMALRRLDKKVWMLTYNNEEHNLGKRPNCVDLSIRMQQFFDHYLKGAPEPEWMKYGLPALEKGHKTGYNLIQE